MGHHHHIHDHQSPGAEKRLWIALILNLGITVAQFIGGIISNSLALISDAVHNLSDTSSIGVSLFARKISKKKPDKQKSFGYKRAEIIGAFVNLVVLVLVALYLIKEGIERLLEPEGIDGVVMFWVALIGLAGNLFSVILLHADSKQSLNIKSSYIHLLWDAIASVAVLIGGLLIWAFKLYIVDPILTIAIALYILYNSYQLLRETINILMEAVPDHLDVDEIEATLETIDSVLDVHHMHIWNMDEHQLLLECHVRINKKDAMKMEQIKEQIKSLLADKYRIAHSTIEFEYTPCYDPHH